MAKWYGQIGFSIQKESDPVNHPSVYTSEITERNYYGDVIKKSRHWQSSENLNDNLTISAQISVISNSFMTDNIGNIVYVTWLGNKWKVSDVEYEWPRITLTLGAIYNE